MLFDLVEAFHRQFGHCAKCERTAIDLELRLRSHDRIEELLEITDACGTLKHNRPRVPSDLLPNARSLGIGVFRLTSDQLMD